MINTINRRTGASSPPRSMSTGWARSVAVSALASLALTAMLGVTAALATSIGVGAGLLAALVVAGSGAAILWTSDTTVAWRAGLGAAMLAGLGLIGGAFGTLCAVVVIGAGLRHLGWRTLIGSTR